MLFRSQNQVATTNSNGTATVNVTGASNTVGITQTSSGTYNNNTTLDITGSSNNVGVTQNATAGNTTVNVKSVGNTNTFTINSNAH